MIEKYTNNTKNVLIDSIKSNYLFPKIDIETEIHFELIITAGNNVEFRS